MKYRLMIQDPDTAEIVHLIVFSPVPEGVMIGWGADCTRPDGIRQWKTIACWEDRYAI